MREYAIRMKCDRCGLVHQGLYKPHGTMPLETGLLGWMTLLDKRTYCPECIVLVIKHVSKCKYIVE